MTVKDGICHSRWSWGILNVLCSPWKHDLRRTCEAIRLHSLKTFEVFGCILVLVYSIHFDITGLFTVPHGPSSH